MVQPLFGRLPVSRPQGRVGITGLGISLAGHAVVLTVVALALVMGPVALPDGAPRVRIPPYVPPPPPPLPLGGASLHRVAARPVLPVTPPAEVVSGPLEPEPEDPPATAPPELPAGGSPTGSASGTFEGADGGQPGGVPGGVPGGMGHALVTDYDRPPRPLHKTRPTYPPEAFVQRVEGTVEVEILIDAEGNVASARVVRSVPLLDTAAVATVREWRFAPALKAGRPVATIARAPVTFRIH